MESKAKILGHPIHQILVVFPLGLLGSGVLFDMVAAVTANETFATVGYWNMVGGVMGGVVAAPFGIRDWIAIPHNTRAKGVGAIHAVVNVAVLGMFAVIVWMRTNHPATVSMPFLLVEGIALGLSLVGAWFGGELVDRLGVGVTPNAHLDAPSSLSKEAVTSVPIRRVE
jgi:uncharacterized membrane protein